jgi:hypothetical protein
MGGRGVIRLKYVHAFRDRTGRMRYYFRRNGKRTPLPAYLAVASSWMLTRRY